LPSSAENFFADEAIARAGILAFTLNGADVPVTFDSFSIKPASSPSPGCSDQLEHCGSIANRAF